MNEFFTVESLPWRDMTWVYTKAKKTLLVILGVTKETNRLVLVRQYRPPAGKYVISAPMGAFNSDEEEDLLHLARAEAAAETGHRVHQIWEVLTFYRSPGITDEKAVLYGAVYDEEAGQQALHSDEDIEVLYVSENEAEAVIRQRVLAGDGVDASVLAVLGLNPFLLL